MSVRVLTIGLAGSHLASASFAQGTSREKKQAERRKQSAAARVAKQKETLTSKSGDVSRRVGSQQVSTDSRPRVRQSQPLRTGSAAELTEEDSRG